MKFIFKVKNLVTYNNYNHWRQTSRKSGGAEWEFKTYLVKFETYSVLRDYETKKTTGAPAPASLAPMQMDIEFKNAQRLEESIFAT